MKINSFFYSLQQGVKNIWRNKLFSLASIATMAACIFLFGLFYMIVTNFQDTVKSAEEGVAVTVFFENGLPDSEIASIGEQIERRPEVAECNFITAEMAWDQFKGDYFEGHEELAEGFESDNPLANSAHYEIYLSDVSLQDALVSFLESTPGVREVHQSEDAAKTLTDLNTLIKYISIGIIAILFAVAVFLISNTVNVGISVRKEEIAVMKLIGATDFFVRAPFIVEGLLIGIIGSAIPLVVLYYLYDGIVQYIGERFSFISSMLKFLSGEQIFRILIPAALIMGVGIGLIGSAISVRRHLKV